jgi:uncharacterized protein (DUF2252 family)
MSILDRISSFNAGREPERLSLKYEAMRRGPLGFLRGTAHLFHEDYRPPAELLRSPKAWITGDLHLENFGSYKGDNRLTYFDINDFDEATLAPCAIDLARFMTSVLVAAHELRFARRDGRHLAQRFAMSYRLALSEGKARWIERQTANGIIRALLEEARLLTRKRLLTLRTTGSGKRRRLKLGKRALAVSREDRREVEAIVARFAAHESEPEFYRVLDVARRVAGTASLGLERYVILVQGRGGRDKQALLDLKQAVPPSLPPGARAPKTRWTSEAERVVSVQRWAQAISPALLHVVQTRGRSYVLRELQPTQNRLSIRNWRRPAVELGPAMEGMGQITAWSHLRSASRQGAASIDTWLTFAEEKRWATPLSDYAEHYAKQVIADWKEFVKGTV